MSSEEKSKTTERLSRQIVIAAAITGALGIAVGAFGAHGLESLFNSRGYDAAFAAKRSDQFEVGVRYHLLQSAMLLALGALSFGAPKWRRWSLRLSLVGQTLFCGSLYLAGSHRYTQIGSNHSAGWNMPNFFMAYADPAVLEIRG